MKQIQFKIIVLLISFLSYSLYSQEDIDSTEFSLEEVVVTSDLSTLTIFSDIKLETSPVNSSQAIYYISIKGISKNPKKLYIIDNE